MKGFLLEHAFGLITGTIVAPLVVLLGQYLKAMWAWLDAQSPWVKRGVVTALATLLNIITAAVGVALPAACANITDTISAECRAGLSGSTFLGAVVSAVLAMAIHRVTRGTPETPSTPAAEE